MISVIVVPSRDKKKAPIEIRHLYNVVHYAWPLWKIWSKSESDTWEWSFVSLKPKIRSSNLKIRLTNIRQHLKRTKFWLKRQGKQKFSKKNVFWEYLATRFLKINHKMMCQQKITSSSAKSFVESVQKEIFWDLPWPILVELIL
jgi:hypothetical protein